MSSSSATSSWRNHAPAPYLNYYSGLSPEPVSPVERQETRSRHVTPPLIDYPPPPPLERASPSRRPDTESMLPPPLERVCRQPCCCGPRTREGYSAGGGSGASSASGSPVAVSQSNGIPTSNGSTRPKLLHSILNNMPPGHHPLQSSYHAYYASVLAATNGSGSAGGVSAVPIATDRGVLPRPRSCSLGSTGSSHRDSCSPGHESTSSHETLSRGSPMSLASSPSPSPPVAESKLFGVLKGTIPSPYMHLYSKNFGSNSSSSSSSSQLSPSSASAAAAAPQSPAVSSPPLKRSAPTGNDLPMDLSCKRSKPSSPVTDQDESIPVQCDSLLETVLRGGSVPSAWSSPEPGPPSRPRLERRLSTSSTCSSASTTSTSTSISTEVDPSRHDNKRVALAKKNLAPVQARVQDWINKLVKFVKETPAYSGLSHPDKLTLLLNAWPRILLLYMAEHNFQFAVTSLHNDKRHSSEAPTSAEVPTMRGVNAIQRFVRRCQNLQLDSVEYENLRLTALFHSAYEGLEDAEFVEMVSSSIRQRLQEHAETERPKDRLRYSSLLLCLHSLFGINCRMVDNIFCIQRNNGIDSNAMIKEMLCAPLSAPSPAAATAGDEDSMVR